MIAPILSVHRRFRTSDSRLETGKVDVHFIGMAQPQSDEFACAVVLADWAPVSAALAWRFLDRQYLRVLGILPS
jgi:hypothetical protein